MRVKGSQELRVHHTAPGPNGMHHHIVQPGASHLSVTKMITVRDKTAKVADEGLSREELTKWVKVKVPDLHAVREISHVGLVVREGARTRAPSHRVPGIHLPWILCRSVVVRNGGDDDEAPAHLRHYLCQAWLSHSAERGLLHLCA